MTARGDAGAVKDSVDFPAKRETVMEGWHCYDLSGTDRNPDKPAVLEDRTVWGRIGTVLSLVPLKRETSLSRRLKDRFAVFQEQLKYIAV